MASTTLLMFYLLMHVIAIGENLISGLIKMAKIMKVSIN
jgi:hypothetical protein